MTDNPALWTAITKQISITTTQPFVIRRHYPVGGGCINNATVIDDGQRKFFVKYNSVENLTMFEAEAAGLEALRKPQALRVPAPVCFGRTDDSAYLVLEYLSLRHGNESNAKLLGEQLARLHETRHTYFGWERDNTIGSTPQINTPSENWDEFWRDRRLAPQLALAESKGYKGSLMQKGERLLADTPLFFTRHHPYPALLHGDLWSGNYAIDDQGHAVIFDPAVYYGDRETDIAMTELFGGFGAAFYAAYKNVLPLERDYEVRKILYNLYHILNHLNLFGGGYARQAETMLDQLRSELG